MNCTKNIIAYGDPGTGKSFICQYIVLYDLLQVLTIIIFLFITFSLMGVRANTLGVIHLHMISLLPTNNKISSSFIYAEKAIEEITRNKKIYHAIRTLDIYS